MAGGPADTDARLFYESAIVDTLFSHANFRGNLRYRQDTEKGTEDRDHIAFWRGLTETQPVRFPHDMLVPIGCACAGSWGWTGRGRGHGARESLPHSSASVAPQRCP